MQLIVGIALVVLSIGSFVGSLPREGKTAKFVGTELEGYVVAGMIGVLGMGVVLCISGLVQLRS
jgi:hypothetical protein